MQERFLAWDRLGQSVDKQDSVQDMIKKAGLDYTVTTTGIYYTDKDNMVRNIPQQEAIIKEDDGTFLAQCKAGSVQIQNRDAFNMVESFVENYGATVEKIGEMDNGRSTFMVAKMPEMNVLGDAVSPYLILRNHHDGSSNPLRLFSTPIRVACSNQLSALEDAKSSVVFRTSSVYDDVTRNNEIVKDLFYIMDKRYSKLKFEAEKFALTKVSQNDFYKLVNELYPTGEDALLRESSKDKNEYYKNNLITAYNKDDLNNFRESAYGVLNAFSDFISHTSDYSKNSYDKDFNAERLMMEATFTVKLLQWVRYVMISRYGVNVRG